MMTTRWGVISDGKNNKKGGGMLVILEKKKPGWFFGWQKSGKVPKNRVERSFWGARLRAGENGKRIPSN